MIDLAKEIWQTMTTNKLRTFLTGLSVAWGIFMLILLLSLSNGVINWTSENISSSDPYRISVWEGYTSMPYNGLKSGRRILFKKSNFDDIANADPEHISEVSSTITMTGQVHTASDYLTRGSVVGVYPSLFNGRYNLVSGRLINDADIQSLRKVIVLNDKAAAVLFRDPENCIGRTVNVGSIAFTVVGVYSHEWDEDNYVPFTTVYALAGYPDKFSSLTVHMVNVDDTTQSKAVERTTVETLAHANNFNPDDPSAVSTWDRFASSIENKKALSYLNVAMWVIGILTLITGIVGVSNIMFVSVRERTHEIGIRRAIGAKPRNVLTQVVLESVALTTCFGYVGIAMGTFVTEIVKRVLANTPGILNPEVDLSIAIEVTVALIIAGAFAGLFPAIRATKVRPVEALSEE